MRAAGADMYGCHGPAKRPLHEALPARFGDAPGGVPHCPMRILREPDPWLGPIWSLVADYQAGVIPGDWRDTHTHHIVSAVDYTLREIAAAQSEAMNRAVG